MPERQWTAEQRQCIEARGGTLLVSAAAGSGKTAVLVERIVSLLTDAQPVDIRSLLVVTFTEAAAAEMRQRLASELTRRQAEQPGNRLLARQLMGLPQAFISTVHSFCFKLLKDHFHMLDLSPGFRIGEDATCRLLREEAMAEVLEEQYQQGNPAFVELADFLKFGKNDKILAEMVGKVYDFIQSHPLPEEWLTQKAALYDPQLPPEKTIWGQLVLQHITGQLTHFAALLNRAAELSTLDKELEQRLFSQLKQEEEMLRQITAQIPALEWDEIAELLRTISFERLNTPKGYGDNPLKIRISKLREGPKEKADELHTLLCCTREEQAEDMAALGGIIQALFDTVRAFSARYGAKKREKKLLDFDDLEHYALQLLTQPNETGRLVPTPLAEELSQRFTHILVDEYQDTNAAQDALFAALSRNGSNLFMVGDVKQSIYGFRQAMPEIFIEKRDTFPPFTGNNFPATISLSHNFRSRPQVTDAVNFVFRQLMSKDTGGIDYNEREELVPSADFPENDGVDTELVIVETKKQDEDETPEKQILEARVIARKIRQYMDQLRVTENKQLRPLQYKDICILLRSKNKVGFLYADELNRLGIPAVSGIGGGFFDAPEVAVAVSYLRFIDNPIQDVPLLAALLSPVFGFTPDDLAAVRMEDRKSSLYVAIRRYAKQDNALGQRLAAFLRQADRYRALAVTLPADKLIHRIYEDTGMLAILSARQHGSNRAANLRQLHDYARRFEDGGFRGLSAFVRYVDNLQEKQIGWKGPVTTPAGNVVTIQSIHQSKGLEFPVVILAGLGNKFNTESLRESILLHPQAGIGMARQDPETGHRFPTLPQTGLKLAILNSQRTEELRVLYVAMTRAKEKLCMVIAVPSAADTLTKLGAAVGTENTLSPFTVMNATGMGDWILMAALRHPSGLELRRMAGDEGIAVRPADYPWQIEVVKPPSSPEAEQVELPAAEPDMAVYQAVKNRMAYRYPYAPLQAVPVKMAASELMVPGAADAGVQRHYVATSRPGFLGAAGLSPAERGTALHLFMQFAKYEQAAIDPEQEAQRLAVQGFLTREQVQSLSFAKIRRFFQSDLYRRIAASPRCRREEAFTVDCPVARFVPDVPPEIGQKETVVVQGIADCVFEEDGQLVIVDYKTDQIREEAELIDRYRPQIQIYAYALQLTLGKPVKECWLYAFALDKAIRIKVKNE